uniref:Uncharacterized protein n=1 Tax=Timema genevievae TaxID=629358 RepID=A0A7R9K135_TIMGE|nr:unnamed protein product [Timema genevievae]
MLLVKSSVDFDYYSREEFSVDEMISVSTLDCAMNRETPYIKSIKNARAPYSIAIYDYCTNQHPHGSSLPLRENVELIAIVDGRQPWTRNTTRLKYCGCESDSPSSYKTLISCIVCV